MNQSEKAIYFRSLHLKSDPLILYNIWDAGGAKILFEVGVKACATGSWSVAAAHGFEDGEIVPLKFVLQIVERIAKSVEVPLTVDFEGGYATDPEHITINVRQLIKAGAVGINFEDRVVQGKGLYSIDDQVERIKSVRRAAEQENIPLFINARTDLFLTSDQSEHEVLIEIAIEREAAYAKAGADGFFVPGLTDVSLIKRIIETASLPVNVMMNTGGSIKEISEVGVSRISFGPKPYLNMKVDLVSRYKNLK